MITVLCYHSLPGSSPQTATWQSVLSSVWCPPWSFISLHCFPCQYLTEVPFMADLSSHPSPACALLRKESSLKCWEQPGNQAETLYSLSSNRSIFHRVQKSSLHLWGLRARDKIKIYFHILYYLQLSWQLNILYAPTLVITPSWWFHRSSSIWGNSDSSKWHNIAGKKEHLQRPKDPSLALFQFASQSNSSLSHRGLVFTLPATQPMSHIYTLPKHNPLAKPCAHTCTHNSEMAPKNGGEHYNPWAWPRAYLGPE